MQAEPAVTPELMYRAAAVVALLDVLLTVQLTRRIGEDGLRRAKWPIAVVAGLFWLAVWTTMHLVFWERVYSHVFPAWSRWIIPPFFGVAYAALALGWRWVGLRARRFAVPAWVCLWGATGALTHAWAVYGRDLLVNTPMLQRLTPASAIVFATFEFGLYGCVILVVASRLRRLTEDRRPAHGGHGPVL